MASTELDSIEELLARNDAMKPFVDATQTLSKMNDRLARHSILNDRAPSVGSQRSELKEVLGIPEATDEQKESAHKWEKLIGRLLTNGNGNQQVEAAFIWWEQECNGGMQLSDDQRIVAFIHAIGMLENMNQVYRDARKIFVTAMNR